MKYENTTFLQYKKNYYSQNGEDGILEELVNRLNIKGGWVCEFGAGNGIRFSNTLNFILKGYKGVFIEGCDSEFKQLEENHKDNTNLILIHKMISHISGDENSLDNILSKTNIPKEFVLLSIDIDSYDYQVWKSLKNYNPIFVIIEINSAVDPTNEKYIHDGKNYMGSSFMATYKLGLEKGYTLVCHTGNMIFIRNDHFKKLGIRSVSHPLANFRRDWLTVELYNKIEKI